MATACRPSTSTIWSRGWRSWRPRKACDAPVIIQAIRGARSYANDIMLAKMMDALAEIYPTIPICIHQDHGNNEATCMSAIRHGFTSVMMDGSLLADAKTPADYEYNVAGHRTGGAHGPLGRRLGRRRARRARLARNRPGRGRGRPWRGRRAVARPAADRSGPGRRFRRPHQGRCAGDRLRHVAWRLQIHAQARRRHPGDARHRGDPPQAAEYASGHARLVVGAAGIAGCDQPLRRRDAADLWRAGRGDRARHPPRGAQGQHRHRLPHGDDRTVPQDRHARIRRNSTRANS